jgi:hypothetical protein
MMHVEGRPVSASSYRAYRCRCPGCSAAAAAYNRQRRQTNGPVPSERVKNVARSNAVRWMKQNFPEEWESCIDRAYEQLGIERMGPGPRSRKL